MLTHNIHDRGTFGEILSNLAKLNIDHVGINEA